MKPAAIKPTIGEVRLIGHFFGFYLLAYRQRLSDLIVLDLLISTGEVVIMKTPLVLVTAALPVPAAAYTTTQTTVSLSVALIEGDNGYKPSWQSVEFEWTN